MKVLRLKGVIGWDISSEELDNFLAEANGEEILVILSTIGGNVFTTLEMIDSIRKYTGTTNIVVGATACSCGSWLPLVFDNKFVSESTIFMAHKVSVSTNGNIDEIGNDVELMKIMEEIIDRLYAENGIEIKLSELGNKVIWKEGGQNLLDFGFGDTIYDNQFDNVIFDKDEFSKTIDETKIAFNMLEKKMKNQHQKVDPTKFENLLNKKNKTESMTDTHKKEKVKMDIKKLKNEHGDVYDLVLEKGAKNERERCSAFVQFLESSPKDVAKAIESGEEMNTANQTKFLRADIAFQNKKETLETLETETAKNKIPATVIDNKTVVTPTPKEGDKPKAMVDAENAFTKKFGGKDES